jgi:hypothetical protein
MRLLYIDVFFTLLLSIKILIDSIAIFPQYIFLATLSSLQVNSIQLIDESVINAPEFLVLQIPEQVEGLSSGLLLFVLPDQLLLVQLFLQLALFQLDLRFLEVAHAPVVVVFEDVAAFLVDQCFANIGHF